MERVLTNADPALRRCWHPVARSGDVTGQPHGHCPLALGRCEAGVLRCAYHGWRFDKDGRCIEIPALGARADRAMLELRRVLGDLVAAVEAGPR